MKTMPGRKKPKTNGRGVALKKAIHENARTRELGASAHEEPSALKVVVKQKLTEKTPTPAEENAVEKSAEVEGKVLKLSEKLTTVSRTLAVEVRARIMLEHQFAAANEQGEAFRHAAFHDALTGLPNRALFQDRLEHGLAQAVRQGWNLAVMFVDLDAFKAVNDTHGHGAGDQVLQTVAERLERSIRSDDTICRHGGDEFLCLLLETGDRLELSAIAKKMINAIQAPCRVRVGNDVINLCATASIGIAMFPQHGTTPEDLIKNADTAMYRAKHGASKVEFAR